MKKKIKDVTVAKEHAVNVLNKLGIEFLKVTARTVQEYAVGVGEDVIEVSVHGLVTTQEKFDEAKKEFEKKKYPDKYVKKKGWLSVEIGGRKNNG